MGKIPIRAQHGRVAVLKCLNFPKRQFGTKGEERIFRAEWCDTFSWLHYDVKTDAAFCYLSVCAVKLRISSEYGWGDSVYLQRFYIGPKAFKNIKVVIVTMRP